MFPTASQLESFTDVFGEHFDEVVEENVSQPLSLPTTCNSPPDNGFDTNGVKTIRPAKHTGQHGEFRSVEEIDPKYRCLFTYPYFNLVQSRIIEDALYSDKSLVVCAPTGSGKTVVFEMAILQLLMYMEDQGSTGDFKIIYMAPVKAVCNERLTEWYPKLTRLGLLCIEVTGDTDVDFTQLSPYRVIITTPEKWDMLTRRWRDHRALVEMIKLFLIDEVHILNDETRGPVLEAVVSRMKTVESAAQSAYRIEQAHQQVQGMEFSGNAPPRIRFVAVSATVSNPEDVAEWLGTNEKPAVFYKFGDECRPVKLQRIVEGYHCAEGTSIFKFDLILNYKLWPIIQKYYNGKPTLIFCNTRKSVSLTAEALAREVTVTFSAEQKAKLTAVASTLKTKKLQIFCNTRKSVSLTAEALAREVTVTFSAEQKAKLTAVASTLKTKKLQMLIMSGVGCHHAGLLFEERMNIERAFRNRDLPILITTTTLAMGVNLPAHLVIVKNTQQYVNGAYQEYSISTVLQMVGRAGRPQFDREATAVIMTRLQDKPRYQALVGGSEPLQSYLHKRLASNLNSEAALGTVTDVAQCVEWLRSTFLYVRAARDPRRHLALPPAAPRPLILKKIEELCVKAMNSLASSGLITMDEASCIQSTEAGRLMSLFYMDVETMKNIMKIEGSETLEQLLWLVCESHELSDMHLRMDERRCLNLLNRNTKGPTIRFPMKGKISTRQMKLNCIIQATLGCLQIPEPSLNQEAMKVMKTATRVCKCLVKYISRPELVSQQPPFYSAVLNSITLSKCIEAHLWENSAYVSKQLKGIGPTFSTLLASAGLTSFMLLEESHPRDLERILNKGPPAGNIIRKQVSLLPKYQLTVTPIDAKSISVQLMLLNHAYLSENMHNLTAGDGHKSYLIVGDSDNHLLLLTQFTDRDFISVYDGTMKYEITRKVSSEHKIIIQCVSSVIVGVDVQADYLFLDITQPAQHDNNLWSYSNIPRQNFAGKQPAITDVYRERKRKNDNDITQCKEKKKREFTLTQKLKALKESFSKTSKSLKTDIGKSVEMSNQVIQDLLDKKRDPNIPDNSQIAKKVEMECPKVDLTRTDINEPTEEIHIHDDDDFIDDMQIDSILSKIESEISGKGTKTNNTRSNSNDETVILTIPDENINTRPNRETPKVKLMYRNLNDASNFTNKSSRCVKDPNRRRNVKSNYSFMDLIEKKANTDGIDNNVDDTVDSGFSDAIKSQISMFLQRAQNTTKRTMPIIDELLNTTVQEELPEVHVKRDLVADQSTNVESDLQDDMRCTESNTTSVKGDRYPLIQQEHSKPEYSGLSEMNCVAIESFGCLEVMNTAPLQRKQCSANQTHADMENLKTPHQKAMEFKSVEFSDYLQKENKTEERKELCQNLDKTLSAELDATLNLEDLPTENTGFNEVFNTNLNLTVVNSTETPIYTNNDLNKCDENKVDESKDFGQNRVKVALVPLNQRLTRNPATHYNHSSRKKYPNGSYIQQNKEMTARTLHTLTKPHDGGLDVTDINKKVLKQLYLKKIVHTPKNNDSINKFDTNAINCLKIGMGGIVPINNYSGQNPSIFPAPPLQAESTHIEMYRDNTRDGVSISDGTWDKTVQIKTSTVPSESNTTALIPYQNVEAVGENKFQKSTHPQLKSFIPCADRHNLFVQDNIIDKMADKFQLSYQDNPQNSIDDCKTLATQAQMKSIESNVDNLKPMAPNKKSTLTIYTPDFTETPIYASKNGQMLDTKDKDATQNVPNNEKETYVKRYSYTATKVDVCTKKYTPDHELRITRKLKLDVDVTEIVKQGKTKTDNKYQEDNNKENAGIKSIQNDENPEIKNLCEIYIQQNSAKNKDISENDESHYNKIVDASYDNKIDDARHNTLEVIEDKPEYPTANTSIGNILQKYSNLLAKPETNQTPIINKSDKTNYPNSSQTASRIPTSRKPFRIREINAIDVPLPDNIINSNKPVLTTFPIEFIAPVAKRIKTDTENQEYEPKTDITTPKKDNDTPINLNLTPKKVYTNKPFDSPVSVHSLQLDPIEDIKEENVFNPKDMRDENMFNPKLLLQYFNEGNDTEDNDIIAPPADFCDNPPVYSPIASQETKSCCENYTEEFLDNENYCNNYGTLGDTTNCQTPPKDIETWCLSKNEDDRYESPIRSAPWVISQRAHTHLGARRDKLCQFKFVRKKPFRPK